MAKGKTPKLTRNAKKITANWNPGDKYDDQEIEFFYCKDKGSANVWVSAGKKSLTKSSDNSTITIDTDAWYPGTNSSSKSVQLHIVGAKLRYKDGGKWSDWGDRGEYNIEIPKPPTYLSCNQDNTQEYTYSWNPASSNTSDSSVYWRTQYQWETCIVPEGGSADWSLAKSQRISRWASDGSGEFIEDAPSYSMYKNATNVKIREKQSDIDARKVRHFRVRCLGPEGASSYLTYSRPLGSSSAINPSQQDGSAVYEGETSSGTSGVRVQIPASSVISGDQIEIQYAFVEPYITTKTDGNIVKSTLSLPNGYDGWQTSRVVLPTPNEEWYNTDIQAQPANNQVLFIRLNTIRNNLTTYGTPTLMTNGVATLSAPTLVSFSADETANPQEITVSVSNIPALGGGNGVFAAVYCRTSSNPNPTAPIGIIPYTSGTAEKTFPASWGDGDTVTVGVKAFVADYSPATPAASGVTTYNISNIQMESNSDWDQTTTATLPKAPTNVRITKAAQDTSLTVEWNWTWTDANATEISWSTNINAWNSNNEPSTYIVSNTRTGLCYITDLSADTYYFRLRHIRTDNDQTVYGPYSDTISKKISSAPNKPTVLLSKELPVVAIDEEVTLRWGYESTDGTEQVDARFANVTQEEQDGPYTYTEIENIRANSAKKFTFTPELFGWSDGSTNRIAVQTRSASGEWSDWSNIVTISVASRPTLLVSGIGGSSDALRPLTIDEDLSFSLALVKMPLRFSISGMGPGGTASVIIERATNYERLDPGESNETAFAGETIFAKTYSTTGAESTDALDISIDVEDLIGTFDHFGNYYLRISITDSYGQVVEQEPYEFTVFWSRFAVIPDADIEYDEDEGVVLVKPYAFTGLDGYAISNETGDLIYTYPDEDNPVLDYDLIDGFLVQMQSDTYDSYLDENGDLIVEMDPSGPDIVPRGDHCRIYRLSADKPQLIMDNATFGKTYVDKYPTYGRYGGYRIVYVTRYGDYVTENSIAAWADYAVPIDKFMVTIEFGDDILEFPGNISLSHSWQKDFQLTKYLGGAIEGDWNPGVERNGTINGTIPIEHEAETMYLLRKLAAYSGVCHVRTPEGSNFYADIQVKDDREEKWVNRLSKISLSYTKVGDRSNDMLLYSDWNE